jgi:hypothetical protein
MKRLRLLQIEVLVLFIAGSVLSACGPISPFAGPAPSPTAPPKRPTVRIYATAVPTLPPGTVIPTAPVTTPVPTPIPANWQTYTNTTLRLTLRYPSGWKAISKTRYAGPDGYFELTGQTYQASATDNLQNKCVLDANTNQPVDFGLHPVIGDAGWFNPNTFAVLGLNNCTVTPAAGRPGQANQAVLYTRLPRPASVDQLLTLHTDTAHFAAILGTLQFSGAAAPASAGGAANAPACAQTPGVAPVTVGHFSDLTITEYAVAVAACDPIRQVDGFKARVDALTTKLADALAHSFTRQVATANLALAPFGYKLAPSESGAVRVDLLQGSSSMLAGITRFGPVSVNAQGKDFVFWAAGDFNQTLPVEVTGAGIRQVTAQTVHPNGFDTAWVGADKLSYTYGLEDLSPVNQATGVSILDNGQPTGALAIPPAGPAGPPVAGFWSWEGHWLLETVGVVFQDGQPLNRHYGYDEMFAWHPVNGKSFFFYHQSGHYGLFYDGQPLQRRYNDVLHGPMCCVYRPFTIAASSDGVWFYARRDTTWYLVSILGGV